MEKHLDFNTVPKFTDDGSYRVDLPLDGVITNIRRFETDYGLQLNPDFQRGHVWTEAQQTAYVEYVLKGGNQQPIRFNHTEWMRFKNDGEMVCVDGLQRITAIMKFLRDELLVFDGYKYSEIDHLYPLRHSIPIIVNALRTRKEVLKWYLDLNTGGTIHTDNEIDKVKNLLKAEG